MNKGNTKKRRNSIDAFNDIIDEEKNAQKAKAEIDDSFEEQNFSDDLDYGEAEGEGESGYGSEKEHRNSIGIEQMIGDDEDRLIMYNIDKGIDVNLI